MTRTALYAGTFDPVTNGHLDIISRAMKLVDRLVIGVAINPGKGPLFSLEERVAILQEQTAGFTGAEVTVQPFSNLLVHFARQVGASVIVRGLRDVADFDYEFQMTGMNQQLDPGIETVFLTADPRHRAVASRLVKEIASLHGDVSAFVPPQVAAKLQAKLGKPNPAS